MNWEYFILDANEILTVQELDTIANNSVIYKNNSGVYTAVALGDSGKVLTSNGATSAPTFETGGGGAGLPVADTTEIIKGSSDATKKIRFEVDGLTTGTTRVLTIPDADLTIVGTDTTQTLSGKTIISDGNVSTAGMIRLRNNSITTGAIGWRNAANDADLRLFTESDNYLTTEAHAGFKSVVIKTIADTNGYLQASSYSTTVGGEIRLLEGSDNGTNYVSFKAPASITSNITWILPSTDSTGEQSLVSDGAGNFGWTTWGDVVTSIGAGEGTDNALVRWNTTAGALIQNSVVIVGDLGEISGITTLGLTGDITEYKTTNDGNPQFRLGATDAEELHIQTVYDSGAQTLDYVLFTTDVASATANKGLYRFNVDGTDIVDINDSGVNVKTGLAYLINGTSVLNGTTLGSGVTASSLTSVGTLASGNATAIVDAATTSAAGKIEIAIASEVDTGTDATRAVSPDSLAGSTIFGRKGVQMVVFDFATNTATGDGKFYFHVDQSLNGMNLIDVHAQVITAGTTNTTDIQIANVTDAVDMLSTKLTIDSGETGSNTAATPAVIDTTKDDVATNDLLRIDLDAISTTPAKGLIITLGFALP